MKPGKLYLKIFLSFVLVLIVTEILVFGLFSIAGQRSFRSRFEQYASSHARMAKEFIEERIRSKPETTIVENEPLKDLIQRLSEIYGAKMWLEGPEGTVLLQSFSGDIPVSMGMVSEKPAKDFGHFKLHRQFKRGLTPFIVIPIEIREHESGRLNVLFDTIEPPHPEKGFALGLVGIGLVIALLIIPVSRIFTKRIKQLRHSALKIAEGDLSHRVTVKGKDEIAELGRSFNQMADKVERMIRGGRELTANVSHELRSPLARIRIAEEILRERWKQGDYQGCERHLDNVRQDIEELDRLIGNILILSKLDIQEASLKRESFNPSDLIRELLEQFKPSISRRSLRLMTDLSFDLSILGDRNAVRTALSNILDNAAKFTPEGGSVIVTMQKQGDCVQIGVTNSFQALSTEDLTRIFEPFYRTERANVAGSGLGLAITRKILERHGGTIEAENAPEGLRILIQLPIGGDEEV
ncbi:MAG: HAMP domain-containing protein [Deltaproteobacteria bacterium]|nr:MAG: HAMP domain-containing protein [Deltaproteobacteria bacterium]